MSQYQSNTVAFFFTQLADANHPGPRSMTQEAVNEYLQPFVVELHKKYYPEAFEDKESFWNYDLRFTSVRDFGLRETAHLEFRDRITGEIADKAKFRDICNAGKDSWKRVLIEIFPGYDRDDLEDAMEDVRYEYFAAYGLIAGFTLVRNFVKAGHEDFVKGQKRQFAGADPNEPTSGMATLYVRFDIDKLSGAYGLDSWKILFSSVSPALLEGCILRMGDSSLTLRGGEYVNELGLTTNAERLKEIREQVWQSEKFKAVANEFPFFIVEGFGDEPLVMEGRFAYGSVQADGGQFSWAKSAWDALAKR